LISPDELTKNLPLAIGASAIIHEQKMTPNENGARDEMEKCQTTYRLDKLQTKSIPLMLG